MHNPTGATNDCEVYLRRRGSSTTAEEVALHRVAESLKPEGERVCYDPYAIRFIGPEVRKFMEMMARDPGQGKERMEQMNRLYPGTQNSIIARVRYFDDFVKRSLGEGLEQLVILGAGYDTRAYRIEGLDKIKVFETDHPATQGVKMQKIKEIFGALPGHVSYVPADITAGELGHRLEEHGYDRSQKTLFLMEGLIYYLPPGDVDETLSFIVKGSGGGSAVLFDYFPASMADGTCTDEVGKRICDRLKQYGEPLLFGINEGDAEAFLLRRGFSAARNVAAEDYRRAYFHGKNAGRDVCSLYSFAYAVVE